ncbi:PREDICTED: ankyrin repeat and LEM domain-containing protein 1 [Chrysochloris asiatica]|uniref:Ankyrin repeat and LEM domain-containing protein 1 n=1 Tax=Chrysochloris asiatica TaxID=185453 RepID=A0A9B0U7B2_CHRAS|nr:PREDICTED: ankyrin repeat and LEM domain-containing protein 1 [Chrysochloris asiatica]
MASATRLAQLLRAALQAEELGLTLLSLSHRDVEELLGRGGDPNLVLPDGASAMHLAAGAWRPRGLRCLRALLRHGGDPNARSAEAVTPLHVAAAWGCRCGLELLLIHGADPTLRDQDGLCALDLAEQQGHQDCARILRELGTRTRKPTPTQEPEPKASDPKENGPVTDLSESPDVTLDSTVLQTHLGRGDSGDMGPSLPVPQQAADQDGSLETSLGLWDGISDTFVTTVEASGAEDSALDCLPTVRSLPQTMQGLVPGVQPPQKVPRSLGTASSAHGTIMGNREEELNTCLQALTLASADTSSTSTATSASSTPRPTQNLPWEQPLGSPDLHFLTDDQTSLDSDVAARWLTEDEKSADVRDPMPICWCPPVPAVSDLELLQRLQAHGERVSPITPLPQPPYLHRPEAKPGPGPDFAGHSPELAKALRTGRIPDVQADEDALAQQFERPDPSRKWREGVVKSSFTYLLLDPRETQDLPGRAFLLTPVERLRTFVRAIFYVGKGTRARPDAHLWEALGRRRCAGKQTCPKVRRILDIWASGHGVVSLHCFQHVVAVEAYTREACLVDALGVQMLTNQKQGHCYGMVADWPPARRRRLGVHLLHRALLVFLAEGERELRPQDIQARG